MQVLLAIGQFKFTVGVNAFQSISKKAAYKWKDIPLFGRSPVLQFTGKDLNTIEISGTSYQAYSGVQALQIFQKLEEEGSKGEPLSLVSKDGKNLGLWVIESVSSEEMNFLKDGTPRKVDFKLGLKKYESI